MDTAVAYVCMTACTMVWDVVGRQERVCSYRSTNEFYKAGHASFRHHPVFEVAFVDEDLGPCGVVVIAATLRSFGHKHKKFATVAHDVERWFQMVRWELWHKLREGSHTVVYADNGKQVWQRVLH